MQQEVMSLYRGKHVFEVTYLTDLSAKKNQLFISLSCFTFWLDEYA
jgi:hypothetical protein